MAIEAAHIIASSPAKHYWEKGRSFPLALHTTAAVGNDAESAVEVMGYCRKLSIFS